MNKLGEKIKRVKGNIESACGRVDRDPAKITLVVVTKSTTIENIQKVIRLGCTELGENRVQRLKKVSAQISELVKTDSAVSKEPNWHMIGHLQRNKVHQVLPVTSLVHSVDTLRLTEEINTVAVKLGIRPRVLLQVNTSKEPQKYGVPVGAATHLAEQIETMGNLELAGMMTMAPLTRNKDVIKACFARARELFEEIKGERIVGPKFTELSMGMSSDYEIAIEQGSTILRIGSAIFSG